MRTRRPSRNAGEGGGEFKELRRRTPSADELVVERNADTRRPLGGLFRPSPVSSEEPTERAVGYPVTGPCTRARRPSRQFGSGDQTSLPVGRGEALVTRLGINVKNGIFVDGSSEELIAQPCPLIVGKRVAAIGLDPLQCPPLTLLVLRHLPVGSPKGFPEMAEMVSFFIT